jgi:fumarate reductase flavoprotein subunit
MMRRLLLFAVLLLVCGCRQVPPLTFLAGTYEVTTPGHNGDIRLSVSFRDSCITDIQVLDQYETPHVGDVVFDRLIPQIIQANGLGVDAVSGASVTSRALLDGVMDAAGEAALVQLMRREGKDMPRLARQMLSVAEEACLEGRRDDMTAVCLRVEER